MTHAILQFQHFQYLVTRKPTMPTNQIVEQFESWMLTGIYLCNVTKPALWEGRARLPQVTGFKKLIQTAF